MYILFLSYLFHSPKFAKFFQQHVVFPILLNDEIENLEAVVYVTFGTN